jgi:hypothetical protein
MALGSYPDVTLKDARKPVTRRSCKSPKGVDPVQVRKVEKLKAIRPRRLTPSKRPRWSGTR